MACSLFENKASLPVIINNPRLRTKDMKCVWIVCVPWKKWARKTVALKYLIPVWSDSSHPVWFRAVNIYAFHLKMTRVSFWGTVLTLILNMCAQLSSLLLWVCLPVWHLHNTVTMEVLVLITSCNKRSLLRSWKWKVRASPGGTVIISAERKVRCFVRAHYASYDIPGKLTIAKCILHHGVPVGV